MKGRIAECAGKWEHFSHVGDVGVRGFGSTKAQAFENAARGLMATITDPSRISAHEVIRINCVAPDDELLFVDWLNALIFEMATRKMLFADFSVRLDDGTLAAEARGEIVDIARHEPAVEIKGATYTELKVYRNGNGRWIAQCVVDV